MSSDRPMTPAADAALSEPTIRLAVFVELLLTAPTRVWSGSGTRQWNGVDWLGMGLFGSISGLEESSELKATGFRLGLSGIPPEYLAVALEENMQGKTANLWFAFFDEQYQLIADPVGPWRGRIDVPDVELGDTATISIAVESRLVDWERARVRRYTQADLQSEYPDDKFFEFIEQMVDATINWGRG